ncbi:MAG: FimV/HubP family polar landmark protein [Myxococcota bacterium]
MNPCDALNAFLNRDLTPTERAAFTEHAGNCPTCRPEVEANRQIEGAISRWAQARGVVQPTRTAVAQLVMATSRRTSSSRAWGLSGWTPAIAVGALAVVTVALGYYAAVLTNVSAPQGQSLVVFEQAGARHVQPAHVPGTVLQTSGTLRARLGSDDIELREPSRLEIVRADDRATELRLDAGLVHLAVTPTLPRSFTVACGRCLVHVTGTHFTVRRGTTDCELVRVRKGRVHVTLADRGEIDVHGGEQLVIDAEGRPHLSGIDERTAIATPPEEPVAAPPRAPTTRASGAPSRLESKHDALDLDSLRTWVTTGRYDDAERALRPHVAAFPQDVEAWSLLGDCLRKQGRFDQAVDAYRTVIAQGEPASSNRARLLAAAILQERLVDHRAAAKLLEELLRSITAQALVPSVKLRLARSYHALGDLAGARRLLQEVLDEAPGASEAHEARQLRESWVAR